MAALANLKHEQFCQELVGGKNGAEAYRSAYGSNVGGAHQAASRLLKRPEVKARIDELRKELSMRNQMSQDRIVQDYEAVFKKGMEHPERGGLAAAHQAKSGQAKILGFAQGKEKQPVDEMSDAEIVKQVREATGNDRLADLWEAALKHSMGEDISADLDRIEANLRAAAALSHSNGKDKQPPTAPTET